MAGFCTHFKIRTSEFVSRSEIVSGEKTGVRKDIVYTVCKKEKEKEKKG